MQRIELVAFLRLLRQQPLDEPEQSREPGLEFTIAGDLAFNVAEYSPKIGRKTLVGIDSTSVIRSQV